MIPFHKNSYIFLLKAFLISQENQTLMFWEMELLNPPLKIFLKICPKKFLIFPDVELLAPRLKHFLYFWKSNFLVLYFFYISKSNFTSSKNKKNHSEKMSYISGNGTF